MAVTKRRPIERDRMATLFLSPCGDRKRGAVWGDWPEQQLAGERKERRCVCRIHVAWSDDPGWWHDGTRRWHVRTSRCVRCRSPFSWRHCGSF